MAFHILVEWESAPQTGVAHAAHIILTWDVKIEVQQNLDFYVDIPKLLFRLAERKISCIRFM